MLVAKIQVGPNDFVLGNILNLNDRPPIFGQSNGYHVGLPPSVCNLFPAPQIFFISHKLSYDAARKIKDQQDTYCSKALSGDWEDLGKFPEDLQWEALVDVLRGRVKVGKFLVLYS